MVDVDKTRLKFTLYQIAAMVAAICGATWIVAEQLHEIRDQNRALSQKLDRVWTADDQDMFVYLANEQGLKLPYASQVRRAQRQ